MSGARRAHSRARPSLGRGADYGTDWSVLRLKGGDPEAKQAEHAPRVHGNARCCGGQEAAAYKSI